jgi:hypothetical protein
MFSHIAELKAGDWKVEEISLEMRVESWGRTTSWRDALKVAMTDSMIAGREREGKK